MRRGAFVRSIVGLLATVCLASVLLGVAPAGSAEVRRKRKIPKKAPILVIGPYLEGAVVQIDGRVVEVDVDKEQNHVRIEGLRPGWHSVRWSHPSYEAIELKLVMRDGAVVQKLLQPVLRNRLRD